MDQRTVKWTCQCTPDDGRNICRVNWTRYESKKCIHWLKYWKSFSMLVISNQMSFKASMVWGLFLYSLSFRQPPKRTKLGDVTSGNRGGYRFFEKILSCSGAVTHVAEIIASQAAANYSCAVPAWTGNTSEASCICFQSFIQELQAKAARAFYMNHPYMYMQQCSGAKVTLLYNKTHTA